jgi:hypothetical protein
MADSSGKFPSRSSLHENGVAPLSSPDAIAEFVGRARALSPRESGAGRLVFALDATLSRQATWDMASALQADMFREVGAIGGLQIRLVYYRGHGECRASGWMTSAEKLASLMSRIDCRGGTTQIGRVLRDARQQATIEQIRALVFVGDAMEEPADALCAIAGELGMLKVPVFVFQEGSDPQATPTFREIARLSGGAWCRFEPGAAGQLRDLLRAAAVYAASGSDGLARLSGNRGAAALLKQMR